MKKVLYILKMSCKLNLVVFLVYEQKDMLQVTSYDVNKVVHWSFVICE